MSEKTPDFGSMTTHQALDAAGYTSRNEPTASSTSARCVYRKSDDARFGHMSAGEAHSFARRVYAGENAEETYREITGYPASFIAPHKAGEAR